GERGVTILSATPGRFWMQFGIALRTSFADELLKAAIAAGIDTVVSLGAGLDTRPWRLELPPELLWIEVDFPDILAYKTAALANARPHCRLERMTADLNRPTERTAALNRGGSRSLLMTEGLLMYLPAETVKALANEALDHFPHWLLDVNSNELMRMGHGDFMDAIN